MARKSKLQDPPEPIFQGRNYVITAAKIKDGLCVYSYEIIAGVNAGDTHNVEGSGVIDDDLATALSMFNAHMACIDDVFKHGGIDVEDLNQMHSHEFSFLYSAYAFKITGGKDNESIVLKGNKSISCSGGRIEIATPKIPLDNLSSYPWYEALKAAADKAREEVALYKEGKNTPVVQEEPEEDLKKQTKMSFAGEAETEE